MPAKSLVIPIETKARELHGKLLLGAFAAEAGFDVLLGDQRVISKSLHRIPQGIYLDKTVYRGRIAQFRRLRDLGFSIAAWCEEGLVYRDKAAYQFERICPASMSLVDVFFAWGEVHKRDVLEVVPKAREKVHAFGNPRFDLLREPYRKVFEDEAREIRSRFGSYILVISTFSRFNRHESREHVLDVLRARGFVLSEEQKDHYHRLVDHLGEVFYAFNAMIPELARAFPDRTIIIRPHPSESHDQWRKKLAPLENVQMVYEGNVEPWICAADAVIHNASTTGIEAFLLGRPAISYMPVVDEVFNRPSHLPNFLSERPQTADAVINVVRSIRNGTLAKDTDRTERNKRVGQHVANANGPLASESIVRTLSEIYSKEPAARAKGVRLASARVRTATRPFASRVWRTLRPNAPLSDYMDQKFPGLSLCEVSTVLEQLEPSGRRKAQLRALPHPKLASCFLITA